MVSFADTAVVLNNADAYIRFSFMVLGHDLWFAGENSGLSGCHYRLLTPGAGRYRGAYGSVEEALPHLKEDLPDIVLLDILLPGLSGIEAIPLLKNQVPSARIIVLTAHEDPPLIFKALSNGASGYLSKSIPAARLVEAISDIIEGGGSFSADIARLKTREWRGVGNGEEVGVRWL